MVHSRGDIFNQIYCLIAWLTNQSQWTTVVCCFSNQSHIAHHWLCDLEVCKIVWSCTRSLILHNFLPRCMHCRRSLAMRILSVCLSVKRVHCDKTEERSFQIFMPYERSFSLVFWEEERSVGATSSTWNFGWTGPHWSEIADFQLIFACSCSAVTSSQKSSINTNRKSTARFPMSPRWSSYVAPMPPKGPQKPQTADLRLKSRFAWRKSATKFLCVKTVSGKVVRYSLT